MTGTLSYAPKSSKTATYIKLSAALYPLLLAGTNFIGTAYYHRPGLADGIFLLLCALPALLNKRWLYLAWGICSTLVWSYLALAVTSDLVHYRHGSYYSKPLQYFGIGYSLTIVSILLSVASIYVGLHWRGKPQVVIPKS